MSKKALFDLLEEQHKFLSGDRVPRINSKGQTVKGKSIYDNRSFLFQKSGFFKFIKNMFV